MNNKEKAAGAGTPTAYAEPFASVRSYADAPQVDCTAKFSVSDALQEAMERHITFMGTVGGGYVLATLDAPLDVPELMAGSESLGYWHGRMGSFLVRPDSPNSRKLRDFAVYGLGASEESRAAVEAMREALSHGEEVTGPVTLSWEAMPLEGENGRCFTLLDVDVWLAVADAVGEDMQSLARGILLSAYDLPRSADYPRQDTKQPTIHYQGLSKVSDGIVNVRNGESLNFDMSGENEAPILVAFSLTYEGQGVSIDRPMSHYDEGLHNAMATQWAAGNRVLTPAQIYRCMSGAKGKPSKKSLESVIESVDKQRKTFVTIDWSAELRGKTGELDGESFTAEQCERETYMLNADKVKVRTTRGNVVMGYVINKIPVLYLHDKVTKQITSYPQKLLEATAGAASSTPRNLAIRDYFLSRISRMKNPHSVTSHRVRYDTLLDAIGCGNVNPKDRQRIRKSALKFLDVFVEEGFISSYSEYRDKGSSHRIRGVEIETGSRG